jgi:predicted  nucleic acid-binding Zn-ribbon protein
MDNAGTRSILETKNLQEEHSRLAREVTTYTKYLDCANARIEDLEEELRIYILKTEKLQIENSDLKIEVTTLTSKRTYRFADCML